MPIGAGPAILLALAAPAATLSQDAGAPFGFSGLEVYVGHENAHSPVVADLDGDALADFALVNTGRARIEVFLQKTADAIAADRARPPRYDEPNQIHDDARFAKELIPLDRALVTLAAADLDDDRRPELVGLAAAPLSLVAYARADRGWERTAEFRLPAGTALGEGSRCLALRRPHLILLLTDRAQIYAAARDGFRLQTELPGSLENPAGMELADLDGDGADDLATFRTGQDNGLSVRFAQGDTFGPEHIFRTGMIRSIRFAQLPGGAGIAVVAVTDPSGRLALLRLSNRRTDEPQLADLPAYIGLAPSRNRIGALGDLDGDGHADLLLANPEQATLDILLGDAATLLRAPRTAPAYAGVSSLCLAGGTLYLASPDESQIGRCRWTSEGLSYPEPLANLAGKPQAVTALAGAPGDPIAYLYSSDNAWGLAVGDVRVELPALRETPPRFFALDIDRDGDEDLVIVPRRDPPLFVRRGEDGWALLPTGPYADMLRRAEEASFAPGWWEDATGLLYVKQNFARLVHLDTNGQLAVDLQVNAPAGANVRHAVLLGEARRALLYDSESKQFHLQAFEEGAWRTERAIPAPQIPSQVFAGGDIVWLAGNTVGILTRATEHPELALAAGYESEATEPALGEIAAGDFNADGAPDLVVFDAKNRALEFLRVGETSLARALAFEMFEQAERRNPRARHLTAADLTGDGKDDLLALVHDRVLLYVQE